MDTTGFEKLLSEWLDEPHRADLSAQVDAAMAAEPSLALQRDRFVRVQRLMRESFAELPRLDESRLAQRISAAIDQDVEEIIGNRGVDRAIAALDTDRAIDWGKFRSRIGEAVDRSAATAIFRRRLRIASFGFAAVAAAAVFALFILRPPPVADDGLIGHATAALVNSAAKSTGGFARVALAPPEQQDSTRIEAPPVVAAEFFLMIEPPARGGA